jgi:hypothetical protein
VTNIIIHPKANCPIGPLWIVTNIIILSKAGWLFVQGPLWIYGIGNNIIILPKAHSSKVHVGS